MDEGIVVVEEGRVVYANEAFCKISGYDAAELAELPSLFEPVPPENRAASGERLSRRLLGDQGKGDSFETVLLHKSGRRVDLELGVRLLREHERVRLIVVARDISERTIVGAVINLTKAFGLGVIAEGIETADQLVFLREMGCELG